MLFRRDHVRKGDDLYRKGNLRKAAQQYLKGRRFRQAARIYAELGDVETAVEIYESNGHPLEAAELLASQGLYKEAISFFERAGAYRQAAAACLRIGNYARGGRLFEKAGMFDQAAECFVKAGELDRALAAFENQSRQLRDKRGRRGDPALEKEIRELDLRRAEMLAKVGRPLDAARLLSEHRNPRRAAPLYERGGRLADAARSYLAAGMATQALAALKRAEDADDELRAEVYLGSARHLDAAEAFTRLGRHDDAASAYEAAEEWARAAASWEEAGAHERAAELYQQLGRHTDARRCFRVGRLTGSTAAVPAVDAVATADEEALLQGLSPPPVEDLPATLPRLEDSELPFDILETLEPWWPGAAFFRVLDHRDGEQRLLVSFPLAQIGHQAEAFRGALRQIAAFSHPAVLKLETAMLASDKVLLLYEDCPGRALGLSARGLRPATALYVLVQLCDALEGAHKLGVTHQRVSPRTVLIDESGRAKLAGLGLRELLATDDELDAGYLSPEISSGGMVGPASDVYSLGRLAIELLGAELPPALVAEPDPAAVSWPKETVEATSEPLRETLARALSHDPLKRPGTGEIRSALTSLGLLPGQILGQRYEILGELGRGGMSRVYRARDLEFDDEVAIKTVLTPVSGRSEDEERLLREVRISRKISHPNVVRVHDFGRFPGGIYVIMELLEGPRLDQLLEREAPFESGRVKRLLREIAAALGEAHRLQIVHRDLKPGNVILVDGRVKVLDFGIARMSDGSSPELTRTGEVIGSPMYMAPEQIQGLELSGTCDLYALGVIAFTLLAGHEPFSGESATAIVLKHLNEPPPDLRRLRPDLPTGWSALISRLLEKDPEKRPRSAGEVIAMLDELPDSAVV